MRDLHLLCGLFIFPFLIVFAASAILLNHPGAPPPAPAATEEVLRPVPAPAGLDSKDLTERVRAARAVLDQLGLTGEIGPVGVNARERRVNIPVTRPGWEALVSVDLAADTATVRQKRTGAAEAVHWLHKLPGPHLVAIRGNWLVLRVWRVLTDAAVYLLLLVTLTGVYLWLLRKAERRAGLAWLGGGALLLAGVIRALA